jgi:putative tricarboxylic transport membrane protein
MFEMLHAFLSGLYQVFAWPTFGLMLLGIAIGFVVGILPGLGGATTLALMLPFIFTMQAVEAFAILLVMAAVTATTGDITSILFGIPGEATTAATIVDGHSMVKKGEAGRALGAALMSSLIGAIVGALALAIPIVRPLVLTFGSPELFMLALLGVTFVALIRPLLVTGPTHLTCRTASAGTRGRCRGR